MAASSDALTSSTARTKRLLVMPPHGSLFGTHTMPRRQVRNMQGESCGGNIRQAYNCYTRQMILRLCQSAKHLAANTEHPAMRSAHHGCSIMIVHLYQSQVQIARPRLGACVTQLTGCHGTLTTFTLVVVVAQVLQCKTCASTRGTHRKAVLAGVGEHRRVPHTVELSASCGCRAECMLLLFAGTRASVSLPFGCHVTSTIPREHRLVVNGSF